MRIGIDAREFEAKCSTGIGRYLKDFLKYVSTRDTAHEYILFCNQFTHVPVEGAAVKKVVIPEYFTLWWDQILLPRFLKKEKVDIFLTPYVKAPVFLPCKLVVIINDLIVLLSPQYQNTRSSLERIYFKTIGQRASRRADKILTISGHSKKDIVKVFGVPGDKIKVIPLGIDKSFRMYESDIKEVVLKYRINTKFILYVGNFSPHKNVGMLIEAYSKLSQDIKDEYKLVLGGKEDKYYGDLLEKVKELGLTDKVVFTGFIPDEDLPFLFNSASVFVFPSLYEGFGLPPLEAMACGAPVITFNAASLPEVVKDAGVFVDSFSAQALAKAIEEVLTNNNLQKSLREKGLVRAAEFTVEKMARGILEVFDAL